MSNIEKSIINNKKLISFFENGCGGNPVAANILKYPGASKCVYDTHCLYDENNNRAFFNITEDIRAISSEFVIKQFNYLKENEHNPHNNYFISTFVLNLFEGEIHTNEDKLNANAISTHGYIGISLNTDTIKIYHVSLHHPANRIDNIEKIGKIGLNLLYNNIFNLEPDAEDTFKDYFIDNIIQYEYSTKKITVCHEECLSYLRYQKSEHFYIFSDGKYRLEPYFRNCESKNIVLTKGSFSPIHFGHIYMHNAACDVAGDCLNFFCISVNNYDKNPKSVADIINTCKTINDLGYQVILFNNALFFENYSILINKFKDINIYFTVGTDTVDRLINYHNNKDLQPLDNIYNAKFLHFHRQDKNPDYGLKNVVNVQNVYPNISSTEIRKKICELLAFLPKKSLSNYLN